MTDELKQLASVAAFSQAYAIVDRYRYECLLERESRYDMASEILESDLYSGDKLKILELIFGIVREKKEGDEK
jgi:hypothetical protein